jgi:hypothetical protein
MGAQEKESAELRQMVPVHQRVITSFARFLANVHHVVDAGGEYGKMKALFLRET